MNSLPKTSALIEEGMARRLHIGAQLYVSVRGQMVADLAFGEAKPGVAMRPDTLMLWMSSTKPVGAAAVAQLWEKNLLQWDDPVVRFIPEFGQNGKEAITIRHLLNHTGGFRSAAPSENMPDGWDQIIAKICQAKLEPGWIPGQRAGYHPASSWFILAEIIRRIDGRPFERYIREEIFLPLGLNDCWVGMPPEIYEGYGDRMGQMQLTENGAIRLRPGEDPIGASKCRPGGNGRGPMRQLGAFYEILLAGGTRNGTRILKADTIAELTRRQRIGLRDETFQAIIDSGLGFILNSAQYGKVPYGYGQHAGPETFGHGGSQSSCGMADPKHQLVIAVVFNGMPGEAAHQARIDRVLTAIEEETGFGAGE